VLQRELMTILAVAAGAEEALLHHAVDREAIKSSR
jgi:hypothetical protein